MTPTITTILLSYNRPRMIREAARSLAAARSDAVIVVDDGSDFDVEAAIGSILPGSVYQVAPKMTLIERLGTARLGRLINQALATVETDLVAYLCDDDLFHPGWLDAARNWFAELPDQHWTRGTWFRFRDGETPGNELCPLDPRQMTTGNFVHRSFCYHAEGIRWNETSVACHDDMFLWDVDRFHNTHAIPHCGAIAGWRREHRHNALHYTAGAAYAPHGADLFAEGMLE